MKKNAKKVFFYDPDADAFSVYIGKGREEEFVELAPGVAVEFDKKGGVIGFEILNASRVFRQVMESAKKRMPAYAG